MVTLNLDTRDEHHFYVGRGKKQLQTTTKKTTKNVSPLSYVDLLLLTLAQHEKNLSQIIERLDRITEKLEKISNHLSDK